MAGEANPATLAATSELAALKRRLAELQAGAKTALGDDYTGLYRDYKYNSTSGTPRDATCVGARIDEARDGNSLQIVDFAVVPQKKSKPRALYILGAGLAFGIGLSLAAWAVARSVKGARP